MTMVSARRLSGVALCQNTTRPRPPDQLPLALPDRPETEGEKALLRSAGALCVLAREVPA